MRTPGRSSDGESTGLDPRATPVVASRLHERRRPRGGGPDELPGAAPSQLPALLVGAARLPRRHLDADGRAGLADASADGIAAHARPSRLRAVPSRARALALGGSSRA